MIAALNYLVHENEAAREAIKQAIDEEHDDSHSARMVEVDHAITVFTVRG